MGIDFNDDDKDDHGYKTWFQAAYAQGQNQYLMVAITVKTVV